MKKNIAILGIAAAALSLPCGANAAIIKKIEDLKNNQAYLIKRQASTDNPNGNLHFVEGGTRIQADNKNAGDAKSPSAHWSLHYSTTEDAFYLYNLGAGKFATGNNLSQAILTDNAVQVTPIYLDAAGYWVFDCGGYILGQEKTAKGQVIFTDNITKSNYKDTGFCFQISDAANNADGTNRTLTDEEVAAIEAKVVAGRADAIAKYQTVVEKAEEMNAKASEQQYAGAWNIAELKQMCANPAAYTLNQFEEAYNRAVASRNPRWGYYRLRNANRPSTTKANNLTVALESGQLKSVNAKAPNVGSASNGQLEDLGLFSFIPEDATGSTARLMYNANLQYVEANGTGKLWLNGNKDNARVFQLEFPGDYKRPMRLIIDENNRVTVSGASELVGYGTVEASMQFWMEKVTELTVTLDANGYKALMLPANISIPEGVKAYCVTSVRDGNAYFEEVTDGVAAHTAMVLKGAPSQSVTLPLMGTPVWHPSLLSGTCVKAEAPARQEIVFTAAGPAFEVKEAGSVLPTTVYFATEDATPLKAVMGADPESGIEEIAADQAPELFDLQGRLVRSNPQVGALYINATTRRVVRIK